MTFSIRKGYFKAADTCLPGVPGIKALKTIDGKPYYFDKDTGYLKLGWFTLNGYKYYGNKAVTSYENGRGVLYTGFKTIDGHHYYFFGSSI